MANDNILAEFIAECEEIIQRVSSCLQAMEAGPVKAENLDCLYRDMHTMKGSAFLFGYAQIGAVAHALETCLEPIRRMKLHASPILIDTCFQCVDLIDRIVKALREGREEKEFAREVNDWTPRLIDAASTQFGGELQLARDAVLDLKEMSSTSILTVPASVQKTVFLEPQKSREEQPTIGAALTDTSVRVQVALLDRLMNLVGELVLVRNQVLQYSSNHEEQEFLNLSKSLDVVTSDLQSEVMRTRMQPIGNVLSKFQRVVRDLARELGKKIDITLQGSETELDKTLIEAIKDPLMHIIRNSCDHGVESPEERKSIGKPDTGRILVRAFHEGGHVVLEISDDGRGLDREKLIKKAIEKGLMTLERASMLSDREAHSIIFLPGFSTASQVTNISGRGVGMDVVKTNIEKIGGSVELLSTLGSGTTIRLKIPLTLAIVPAILIRCGAQCFAIPQIKLVELVRVEAFTSDEQIEILQDHPVLRLRGNLLPLVDLKQVLGWHELRTKLDFSMGSNIIVLNAEGQIFGLMVDEILDTADIVVKPLSSFLAGLSIFSGATIKGDGSIALILDIIGVAEASHIEMKKSRSASTLVDATRVKKKKNADAQEFLLFRLNSPSTHAIPLCLVHRLEELPAAAVEKSGDQLVVKYRDVILPLLSLDKSLGYESDLFMENSAGSNISVVVVQREGRLYGLIVKDIQDIVYIDEQIDDSIRDRIGVRGNVIQKNHIIIVVDVLGVVEGETCRAKKIHSNFTEDRSTLEGLYSNNREHKHKKAHALFSAGARKGS